MKTLYALVTEQCNLSCPYCTVKNKEDIFDRAKFLQQIRSFNGEIIIFGGEPSLYPDRIRLMIPYADSITTNLLILTEELKQYYNILDVATSWTPERFSYQQFIQWKDNVRQLQKKPTLLITLTPGVLKYSPVLLQEMFDELVEDIVFEQLIDETKDQDFYKKVDMWLLSLYKSWTGKTPIVTFKEPWYFDCSETYTLYPDGTLRWGCPQLKQFSICNDCLNCSLANVCKPCMLQQYCTRPRKLMEAIGR